jgi:Uma2 family endonuclease
MSIAETVDRQKPIFSPLLHRYTLEEFLALPDPGELAHYDLIGGHLFRVPPPDPPHGDVSSNLNASLAGFVAASGMPGRIYHPREAIYLGDTYIEPDMMYVSNALRAKMGDRRTSADIVFEILSRTTANYDRTVKADTYLALGVQELWLVDPMTRTIEIRNAAIGKEFPAWTSRLYGAHESALSVVLTGWHVSVDSIFAGI